MFQIGQFACMRRDALPALLVADQQFRAGIRQAIAEFRTGPPCVERHDDRADRGGGEEGDRPFGQVAHRQCDPVALGHAQFLQMMGQSGDGAEPAVEGDALILVHNEFAVAMRAARQRDGAQAGRGVLPGAQANAADLDLLHLEALAGRGQHLAALLAAHRRPSGGRRPAALFECGRLHGQRTSNSPAAPMPPPTHMVTTT